MASGGSPLGAHGMHEVTVMFHNIPLIFIGLPRCARLCYHPSLVLLNIRLNPIWVPFYFTGTLITTRENMQRRLEYFPLLLVWFSNRIMFIFMNVGGIFLAFSAELLFWEFFLLTLISSSECKKRKNRFREYFLFWECFHQR